jgi:hypothetical protein
MDAHFLVNFVGAFTMGWIAVLPLLVRQRKGGSTLKQRYRNWGRETWRKSKALQTGHRTTHCRKSISRTHTAWRRRNSQGPFVPCTAQPGSGCVCTAPPQLIPSQWNHPALTARTGPGKPPHAQPSLLLSRSLQQHALGFRVSSTR